MVWVVLDHGIGGVQRGGEFGLIERRTALRLYRIDQHIGDACRIHGAIPEAAMVRRLRVYLAGIAQRVDVVAHEALGGCVVLGGVLAGLLGGANGQASGKAGRRAS